MEQNRASVFQISNLLQLWIFLTFAVATISKVQYLRVIKN